LASLLRGGDLSWWIAGGWAIDLFVGRQTRPHGDTDVLVLRRDQLAVQAALGGWDLHTADPPGTLRPWAPGEVLPAAVHDIWCRAAPDAPWALQLMLADAEGGRWVFRRDRRISGPLARLGRRSPEGLPYLAPEVQLLYKAKRPPRPKDEADFAAALPLLGDEGRRWLAAALATYDPAHPWRSRLTREHNGAPDRGASEDLRRALAHVLWIGGATDAGKTSIAQALAARHGLQAYHYDRLDRFEPPGHWARVDPARHPHMRASMQRSRDDAWVLTTPEQLAAAWLRSTPERFSLTLEDLQALPPTPPIVAEGYGLLPELVAPLLGSPHQAIWLVPSEAFKRASHARRGKGAFLADTSDPERARSNHLGRDLLIADHVRRTGSALGLTVVEVDGSRPLDEVTAAVDAHFARYLAGR
jgi:hypothetical protein